MFGRFASPSPDDDVRRIFGAAGPPLNNPPSWNVASPSQPAMVIRSRPEAKDRRQTF
jgi:hypothetical protein